MKSFNPIKRLLDWKAHINARIDERDLKDNALLAELEAIQDRAKAEFANIQKQHRRIDDLNIAMAMLKEGKNGLGPSDKT